MDLPWTGTELLWATERLTALAVLLQSVEWLQVRAVFAADGVWRYGLLEPEQRALPWPAQMLCRICLPYPGFVVLLALRCVLSGLALVWGVQGVWPWLCISQILVCVRFRGASNGGSDSMSVVLLSALSVPALLGGAPVATQAALLYVGVQVTLSYVIAGLVKLRQPDWRSGQALRHFVATSPYGALPWLSALLARRSAALVLSWAVIAFECLFPLAWVDVRACAGCLVCGVLLHAANLLVFGLNRFFWVWLAGYPAVMACCQLCVLLR